jgi:hexulose-6-phosphate isomerase
MNDDLTRRTFMQSAAATAIAAPALARAATDAATPAGGRSIKRCLKWGMVKGDDDVASKFSRLAKIGFDGVELDSPGPLDLDEVRRAIDATGVTVPGVVGSEHWRSPLSHPDVKVRDKGRKALDQAIRDCATVGGTTVLLVPAVVNAEVGYDDAYTRSQAAIREALPLAEELDIRIALENVWNHFLLSPMEAARYVDEFNSPHLGWYFDVGNIVNYGWPEQWVRILDKRIMKLDVKEFSRKRRNDEGLWKGFGVEIGDGDCNWPAVMAALDEIGFTDGWASAEVGGGDDERLTDILARMDRVLAM